MDVWEERIETEIESYEWEIADKSVIVLKTERMLQLFPQSLVYKKSSSVTWGVGFQSLEIWNVIVLW